MNYHDAQAIKKIAKYNKRIEKYKRLALIANKLNCVKTATKWSNKAVQVQQELDWEFPVYEMGTVYTGLEVSCGTRLLSEAEEMARNSFTSNEMVDSDDEVIIGYRDLIFSCFRPSAA